MPPQKAPAEVDHHPARAERDGPAGGLRRHLRFLDGIRGLAALYVAIFHACSFEGSNLVAKPWSLLVDCFRFGHLAVGVFIVLSGFCLMLPVVTDGGGHLPRGFAEYLRRRAWRILPPYYAAFGMSAAILAAGLALRGTGLVQGEDVRQGFSIGSFFSHLLLIHNLNVTWAYSVNSPLWTVATEWQIYFLFPLVLLPMWRHFGNVASVTLGFGIGLAPMLFLRREQSLWWAGPWYLGLFGLGMAAADYSVRFRNREQAPSAPALLGIGSLALLVLLCSLRPFTVPIWVLDAVVGLAASCLIAYCALEAAATPAAGKHWLLRVLQSAPIAGLGAFSYSLYLIHFPLQRGLVRVLQTLHLTPEQILFIQIFIGMPLIIGLAYLFYQGCERPFMLHNRKRRK